MRVIIQAAAFEMVQLFLFEGEHSGLAGNLNAGVPVTFQSRLLIFGGNNVHYHMFKMHVMEHMKP